MERKKTALFAFGILAFCFPSFSFSPFLSTLVSLFLFVVFCVCVCVSRSVAAAAPATSLSVLGRPPCQVCVSVGDSRCCQSLFFSLPQWRVCECVEEAMIDTHLDRLHHHLSAMVWCRCVSDEFFFVDDSFLPALCVSVCVLFKISRPCRSKCVEKSKNLSGPVLMDNVTRFHARWVIVTCLSPCLAQHSGGWETKEKRGGHRIVARLFLFNP